MGLALARWRAGAFVLLVGLVVVRPGLASTRTPTAAIQEILAEASRALTDPSTEDHPEVQVRTLVALLERVVAFPEAAQLALGPEWHARSAAEQAEFLALFIDMVERSLVLTVASRAKVDGGFEVRYRTESLRGDHATVRVTMTGRDGNDLPVEFRMVRRGAGWAIRDLAIDGISFMSAFRAQFRRILRQSSYAELIARMRARNADVPEWWTAIRPNGRRTPPHVARESGSPTTGSATDGSAKTRAAPIAVSVAVTPVPSALVTPVPAARSAAAAAASPEPSTTIAVRAAPSAVAAAPSAAPSGPIALPAVPSPVAAAPSTVSAGPRLVPEVANPVPPVPTLVSAVPTPVPAAVPTPVPAAVPTPVPAMPSAASAASLRAPAAPSTTLSASAASFSASRPLALVVSPTPDGRTGLLSAPNRPAGRIYWVQIGLYENGKTAIRLLEELLVRRLPVDIGPMRLHTARGEVGVMRVRVGPYADRAAAAATLVELKRAGYSPILGPEAPVLPAPTR